MTTTFQYTATADQVTTAIETARRASAKLRHLAKTPVYRNGDARQRLVDYTTKQRDDAHRDLCYGGYTATVGLLVEEDKLRVRLASASLHGQERPELRERLRLVLSAVRDVQRNLPDDVVEDDGPCVCGDPDHATDEHPASCQGLVYDRTTDENNYGYCTLDACHGGDHQ